MFEIRESYFEFQTFLALPYLLPFVSGQEHFILIKNKQLLFSIITFLMLSCDLNSCFVIEVLKIVVTSALIRVFYLTKSRSLKHGKVTRRLFRR